jgi:phage baseplate assembly protein W
MAVTEYTWPLVTTPAPGIPADVVVNPFDRILSIGAQAHLGYGLLRPFRRDKKNDFANDGGVALVKSAVGQVLGTMASSDYTTGEMPWRTEFGSLMHLLRHANIDESQELARYYILQALQTWEPRVLLKRASVTEGKSPEGEPTVLEVRVVYDVIKENSDGNQVVLPDVTQEQQVATA